MEERLRFVEWCDDLFAWLPWQIKIKSNQIHGNNGYLDNQFDNTTKKTPAVVLLLVVLVVVVVGVVVILISYS